MPVTAANPVPDDPALPREAGQRLARGVTRLMREMHHAALTEFVPIPGLRVDVMALTPAGEVWIIECKSCRADFLADRKWQGYLEWCDRFFWATDCHFPTALLPEESGLIVADAYAAELVRPAPLTRLAAARRTRLTRDFARVAAWRVQAMLDPTGWSGS
ncbi:DNA repair protein MmcB-related protein [Paracoccus suum]|uniref:DNA repair protein MmcB-related protein n=1 Tax=Paracoccus suum TaxID=2259340 RepID=A0A344PLX0_9RHOB|nr:MmcB family DNA repair protein [Paracoccus suum]AXC50375.1 DNA repair protein MmcB-related protein [Paracoccus suum]